MGVSTPTISSSLGASAPSGGPAATEDGAGGPALRAGVATCRAPRERVRRASTYEAPPSVPPMREEPRMSSHAPPDVAPPRPVAGAVTGPAVPSVVRTIWAGMPALPTTKPLDAVPATERTCRLDEGAALAAGARDGHGVAAGGHGEISGGVAESHIGRDDLAVHADVGLADLGRHVDRPEGGLSGLDAVVLVHEQVDALVGAHGDHGVLAGAEADNLGRDRRRLAVQDKSEARLSWTKDLVSTGLCEGRRKPRTALLNQQGGGSGTCDGVQETDLSLV